MSESNHHISNKKFKPFYSGLALAIILGLAAYALQKVTKSDFADPLLIALILGIFLRSIIGDNSKILQGIILAPKLFIPIGIIFYAFKNINFVKYAKIDPRFMALTALVLIAYFVTITLMGKLLKQKKEITYLTATGSGICGASAITITSHAMNADSDDVSISLLSVAFVGILSLFVILPLLGTAFELTNRSYALLSGALLQFTGFVKAAMASVPHLVEEIPPSKAIKLALSVKATRYLGLLIAIPVFGSIRKNKRYSTSILIMFIISGVIGSFFYAKDPTFYSKSIIPVIKPIYGIFWSISMAAVGLNADVKQLLSNNGLKALAQALCGFVVAIAVFFIGFFFI